MFILVPAVPAIEGKQKQNVFYNAVEHQKHQITRKTKSQTPWFKTALLAALLLGKPQGAGKPTGREQQKNHLFNWTHSHTMNNLRRLQDPKYREGKFEYANRHFPHAVHLGNRAGMTKFARLVQNDMMPKVPEKGFPSTVVSNPEHDARVANVLGRNQTIIRGMGGIKPIIQEYAAIRGGIDYCRCGNAFTNDPDVPKNSMFFGPHHGILIDAEKAFAKGRVHRVSRGDAWTMSNPFVRQCGQSNREINRRATWNQAIQYTKYNSAWTTKRQSVGSAEVNLDITDDIVLGLVINPKTKPTWETILEIQHGSESVARTFGQGPSKLTNVYMLNVTTNQIEKVRDKYHFEQLSNKKASRYALKPKYTLLQKWGLEANTSNRLNQSRKKGSGHPSEYYTALKKAKYISRAS